MNTGLRGACWLNSGVITFQLTQARKVSARVEGDDGEEIEGKCKSHPCKCKGGIPCRDYWSLLDLLNDQGDVHRVSG